MSDSGSSSRLISRRMRRGAPLGLLVLLGVAMAFFAAGGMAAKDGSANLAITKTDSPDPVNVGSALTYTIGVQNLGPDSATGVRVTDDLPKEVDLVSATATVGKCASKGQKVTCELGQIGTGVNYGGPATVSISVIPRKTGTIKNTASVNGDQKDPVASNNKATATTSVIGPAATCRGVAVSLAGTAGNDVITGTGGRDVIATFRGNDTIASLGGRDLICAGSGTDRVAAGSARDRVFGGAGEDRLFGRDGPDVLRGGAGPDVLKGNSGDDRLRGGRGIDRCRGGAGSDSIRGCER
jgi:uncharacterized repeat protein (TIGR01451 family)